MVRRIFCCGVAAVLLSGCATTEPGWTGQGAVPFGEAESACKTATEGVTEEAARKAAFEECMDGKGWTRS
jgi:8-oxo-dGTP pyrophosphatase MutT (NUDIX family)